MNSGNKFEGYWTALVTPFSKEGGIDGEALKGLVRRQREAGVTGIVAAGTTGESAALSFKEKEILFRIVREECGAMQMMAGIGSNVTAHAADFARQARAEGANSLLAVVPYYNKPGQEGLYRHFMTIADATDLPLWLYSVPGRTGIDLTNETIARLARHPNIVGLKDASANLARPQAIRRLCGSGFGQLSGEDATILSYLAAGGHGAISVTANIAPEKCVALFKLWKAGKIPEAIRLEDTLFPLHQALFLETSPAPAKYALAKMGLCREDLRLPLVPISGATRREMDEVLRSLELLERA